MMIIGLTGSIAMGKSEAAKILAAYGLPVFDADAEVHRLYDSKAGADLIEPFVPEATHDDKVNRELVTKAVLADPALLSRLEKMVHAEIRNRREGFLARAKASGAKAVVIDIPLLFETGAQGEVDKTIVISAAADLQKARALSRPGMSAERLAMILAKQMPDVQKRSLADVVIENNGTVEQLKTSLLAQLKLWGI